MTTVPNTDDSRRRVDWPTVVRIARGHVHAEVAAVGVPPTLRRLHYLLVSDPAATALGYANTTSAYKRLSEVTARAREAGTFPALDDRTRTVERPLVFASEQEARTALAESFRLDRRPHCDRSVVVVAEKDGLLPLLLSRFWWLDVTATRGYPSLTHARRLSRFDVAVYAGDLDPTGEDIDRDLAERSGIDVRRVALTWEQVTEHRLPPAPAKPSDSRTARMAARYGHAVQVEVDALPSAVLLDAVAEAVTDATGLDLDESMGPVLPDVDAEEQAIRDRLRDGSTPDDEEDTP